MRNYKVVFCFLDKDGFVERNKHGEVYHSRLIQAYNKGEAIDKLREQEKFVVEPEIVSVEEAKNDYIRDV